MRNKVTDIYQSVNGYKITKKSLGLQQTIVRDIIYKWRKLGTVVNLAGSGWLSKTIPHYSASMSHPEGHKRLTRQNLNFLEGFSPISPA